jgi:hypothetical protein
MTGPLGGKWPQDYRQFATANARMIKEPNGGQYLVIDLWPLLAQGAPEIPSDIASWSAPRAEHEYRVLHRTLNERITAHNEATRLYQKAVQELEEVRAYYAEVGEQELAMRRQAMRKEEALSFAVVRLRDRVALVQRRAQLAIQREHAEASRHRHRLGFIHGFIAGTLIQEEACRCGRCAPCFARRLFNAYHDKFTPGSV